MSVQLLSLLLFSGPRYERAICLLPAGDPRVTGLFTLYQILSENSLFQFIGCLFALLIMAFSIEWNAACVIPHSFVCVGRAGVPTGHFHIIVSHERTTPGMKASLWLMAQKFQCITVEKVEQGLSGHLGTLDGVDGSRICGPHCWQLRARKE